MRKLNLMTSKVTSTFEILWFSQSKPYGHWVMNLTAYSRLQQEIYLIVLSYIHPRKSSANAYFLGEGSQTFSFHGSFPESLTHLFPLQPQTIP